LLAFNIRQIVDAVDEVQQIRTKNKIVEICKHRYICSLKSFYKRTHFGSEWGAYKQASRHIYKVDIIEAINLMNINDQTEPIQAAFGCMRSIQNCCGIFLTVDDDYFPNRRHDLLPWSFLYLRLA
jgi:hypothetical protein